MSFTTVPSVKTISYMNSAARHSFHRRAAGLWEDREKERERETEGEGERGRGRGRESRDRVRSGESGSQHHIHYHIKYNLLNYF